MRDVFGWSLPPGVTNAMIEDAVGGDDVCHACLREDGIEEDMIDKLDDDCPCQYHKDLMKAAELEDQDAL